MALLNREQISASARTLKTYDIEIPLVGGEVRFRELSVAQAQEYQRRNEELEKAEDEIGQVALLLSWTLVDEDGKRMFPGDAGMEELRAWNTKTLMQMAEKAGEILQIDAPSIDAAAKN
jgi:hypothetical protein